MPFYPEYDEFETEIKQFVEKFEILKESSKIYVDIMNQKYQPVVPKKYELTVTLIAFIYNNDL